MSLHTIFGIPLRLLFLRVALIYFRMLRNFQRNGSEVDHISGEIESGIAFCFIPYYFIVTSALLLSTNVKLFWVNSTPSLLIKGRKGVLHPRVVYRSTQFIARFSSSLSCFNNSFHLRCSWESLPCIRRIFNSPRFQVFVYFSRRGGVDNKFHIKRLPGNVISRRHTAKLKQKVRYSQVLSRGNIINLCKPILSKRETG